MRIFVDSANVDHIKEISATGAISGVTTNPSLIAKEGRNFRQVVQEITEVVDGPISAEVISVDAEGMVREAEQLAKIHPNVVIKVPMTEAGLAAASELRSKGIDTNVTLVFSANQALLAARAGATYVSPFVGRLDDIGQDGMLLIADIAEMFQLHDLDTQIIAASIRHPLHVTQSALAGAHIATIPYKVLKQMIKHPLTDAGIEKFLADWETVKDK